MATFRTKIAHKKGTEIEIFGFVAVLDPDKTGLCTFDVPDDREDVIERLLEIPEGFEAVKAGKQAKAEESVKLVSPDGTEVDIATADKATLLEIGASKGLEIAPQTGIDKIRKLVADAFKAT